MTLHANHDGEMAKDKKKKKEKAGTTDKRESTQARAPLPQTIPAEDSSEQPSQRTTTTALAKRARLSEGEEGAGLSQCPNFAAAALATARGTKRDDTHAQPSTPPTAGTPMPDTSARAVSTWLAQDIHAGESPGHSHNDGSMDASDRAGASFGSARTAHRPAPITGNSVIKPASKKTRVDNVDEHTLLVARMDALVDCPQSVDTAKTFVTTIICPHALTAAPPHGLAAVGMDESMLKESTLHKIESGWKCVEWLCKGPPEKPAPYSLVMQVM